VKDKDKMGLWSIYNHVSPITPRLQKE